MSKQGNTDATAKSTGERPEPDASILGVVFYVIGALLVLAAGAAAYTFSVGTWAANVLPLAGGALVNFGFGAALNHLKALRGEIAWIASVLESGNEAD